MKTYGRYEIIEQIGQGAMGNVYKGFDPQIKRNIALKVLREDQLGNTPFVERFAKEAMAIGRLSHPNIVTVYDVGEDHHTIYIVMELLEGAPLNHVMEERRLSLSQAVDIGIRAAEALDYAHKKGIVHRDIKTTNILMTRDNQVKLTDFGIAHFEDPQLTMQTQAGEILGTPAFMSPEQVTGKPVDGRSDLFSLGVILYEMVTGKKPFTGSHLPAIFDAIIKQEPAPPVHPDRDIPENLARVILKCLEKRPDERFQTGGELAQALYRCLPIPGEPAMGEGSGDPSPPYADGTVWIGNVSDVSASPSQQEESAGLFPMKEEEIPSEMGRKSAGKKRFILAAVLFIVMVSAGAGYYLTHRPDFAALKDAIPSHEAVSTERSRLTIATEPAGALVYIDAVYKGKAPVAIHTPYGSHEIRITREGYFEQAFQLTIDQPEVKLTRRLISEK